MTANWSGSRSLAQLPQKQQQICKKVQNQNVSRAELKSRLQADLNDVLGLLESYTEADVCKTMM